MEHIMRYSPPVCMKCMLIMELTSKRWECPNCFDFLPTHYLLELTAKQQRLIKNNTEKLKLKNKY